MIELHIKSKDGTITNTLINIRNLKWVDYLEVEKEIIIWFNSSLFISVTDEEIVGSVEDVYKRIKLLLMKN
ncbi:MAG: hypothetical protein IGQ45_15805 [Cyanobacterium sp. T60_A2020_053]|nr:hypothetical protein [Cyanobacterium sp. T60_A2020_053]